MGFSMGVLVLGFVLEGVFCLHVNVYPFRAVFVFLILGQNQICKIYDLSFIAY